MANKVNEQITDSLSQTNTQVLASVPASAMGNLCTAMGQAMSNLGYNASSAQLQASIAMQAATVQGVNSLTSVSSSVLSRSSEGVLTKND